MRHLQKFNETSRARTKGTKDPLEILEDKFRDFIEEVEELGEYANWEFKSGEGVGDKESADGAIEEYGKKLSEVNQKFETFKSAAKLHYGDEILKEIYRRFREF